jgi:hypothetical protein
MPSIARRPFVAWLALGTLFACTAAVVVFASAGPSGLVANSKLSFPGWLAGPLHGLFGHLPERRHVIDGGFSALIVVMMLAYGVALAAARSLSMRVLVLFVLAAEVVLLLGPPLQLTDVFNYLGYARLGALHHLNPYTHGINAIHADPVWVLATWHNWRSPYGSLFTALTYPVGLLSLPAAYWTMKAVTVLVSLVFLWLVYKIARQLGRDPRLAVLFVAANPIYLLYAVGEFHMDFFMLVPALGAIALLLSGRQRLAGVALAVGVAVKVTLVILLPFLLLGARGRRARVRLLTGLAIGAVPLAALSIALFGLAVPNISGQGKLLSSFSVPNILGWGLGLGGGSPTLLRDMNFVIVAVVAYQFLRARDWLSGAGWATVALLASLGWLMPWYVVWLLPLAAVSTNVNLRRVAIGLTCFLVAAFLPVTWPALKAVEINPVGSPVGVAAFDYQWISQYGPLHKRQHLALRECRLHASVCAPWRQQRRA